MLREFLDSEAAGGVLPMCAAGLSLFVANSPLADDYFALLQTCVGGLSLLNWINDGLMAVLFLFADFSTASCPHGPIERCPVSRRPAESWIQG